MKRRSLDVGRQTYSVSTRSSDSTHRKWFQPWW